MLWIRNQSSLALLERNRHRDTRHTSPFSLGMPQHRCSGVLRMRVVLRRVASYSASQVTWLRACNRIPGVARHRHMISKCKSRRTPKLAMTYLFTLIFLQSLMIFSMSPTALPTHGSGEASAHTAQRVWVTPFQFWQAGARASSSLSPETCLVWSASSKLSVPVSGSDASPAAFQLQRKHFFRIPENILTREFCFRAVGCFWICGGRVLVCWFVDALALVLVWRSLMAVVVTEYIDTAPGEMLEGTTLVVAQLHVGRFRLG